MYIVFIIILYAVILSEQSESKDLVHAFNP